MKSSIVRKAKAARRFGLVIMVIGLVPVLFFLGQSILASAGTDLLATALLGLAVMMAGAAMARRQDAVLAAAQRDREEGLRRAYQYYDGERIEPFIGPGLPGIDALQEDAGWPGKKSRMSA